MSARAVAAGYTERAAFVLAEQPPPEPLLLPRLLAACRHVAEVPSGAGHYLAAYARAGTHVTLVDGNEAMLRAAAQRAASAGLPPRHLRLRHELIGGVHTLKNVDGLVVPNAAVNQLACQSGLADLLATLRALLPAGAPILLQALCLRPEAPADACGFYDPGSAGWPTPEPPFGAFPRRSESGPPGPVLSMQGACDVLLSQRRCPRSGDLLVRRAGEVRGGRAAAT